MSRITEKISTVGLWCIAAGLFLASVILLGTCGLPGLFMALLPLTISGILFWRLISNAAGEGFIHFFLAPHAKLSAPPVSLTPVRALLSEGRDAEAETALLELLENHPGLPDLYLLLLELYDRAGRNEEGARLGLRYFADARRMPGDENYGILMLCCDQLQTLHQEEAAAELLLSERKFPCYSAAQQSGIARRIDFLTRHSRRAGG